MHRLLAFALMLVLVAAACSPSDEERRRQRGEASFDPGTVPGTTFLEYRDASARALDRAAREPRPVANSAMPPRHLDTERFPDVGVDRFQIVSGGPPPDGIPSIDEPSFTPAADVDFLDPAESVIVLEIAGTARIYPVQILLWHEIVNDRVGDRPITVTYCPLCNSAVGFERLVEVPTDLERPDGVDLPDEIVLDFGTTGAVHHSALVMYDRQTESLWTHFDGRAVVGTLMGLELELVPLATVSWGDALERYPDALVLDRNTGFDRDYGINRYIGYDQAEQPLAGFFSEEIPTPIGPMERVVGLRAPGGTIALERSMLVKSGVESIDLERARVVVFWTPGTSSPLQRREVAEGDDIGSVAAFDPTVDGEILTFTAAGAGAFVDEQTGSRWDILGHAVDGPLVGTQLRPVEHLDTFWFAWVAHHPGTELVASAES